MKFINQLISKLPINNMSSCLQQPSYSLNKHFPSNQNQKPSQVNSHQSQSNFKSNQDEMQCYSNKQFLQATFGNNLDYIQIFLTLSHEEKAKLYQLMQGEQQSGNIIDKESYIKILAIMINKLQNKCCIQQNQNTILSKRKSYNKQKEKKIESIVEPIYFKQCKMSTILKDIKKWEEQNNIEKQIQQTLSPDLIQTNKNMKIADLIKENAKYDSLNDIQDNVHTPSTNSMSQKQNLNIFDSFKEVTKKVNKKQQNIISQTVQLNQTQKRKGQSAKQQFNHLSFSQNNYELMKETEQNAKYDKIKIVPNLRMKQSVINIQMDKDSSDQEQEYHWKEAIVIPSPKTAETIGKKKLIIPVEESIQLVSNQPQAQKNHRININLMKKPLQSNFLSEMKIETSVVYVTNISNISHQSFQDDNFCNYIADPPKLMPEFAKMHSEQNNLIKFQSNLKKENKYFFLDHLKIQLSPQNLNYLKRQLKNKSFECNSQFYVIIINYLKSLSLQESPEFQHFSKQLDTIKQISSLTLRYSKAVEEDQQQKVHTALLQSKRLYKQIFNSSHRTEQFIQNIMNNQFKQKGFLYKFGLILVDSNVNKNFIEGTLMQGNLEDIENSFYYLYILQKLNSLSKLTFRAEKIIVYLNYQNQKIKNFDKDKLRLIQRDIQKHPKFIEFIRDLLKICSICERIIYISKVCCIRIQGNIVKTLKICKQIKNKYLDYAQKQDDQLCFKKIKDFIKKGVIKNKPVSEIQTDFSQQIYNNPLCCICLKELPKSGGKIVGQNWFHDCCFYFINQFQICS